MDAMLQEEGRPDQAEHLFQNEPLGLPHPGDRPRVCNFELPKATPKADTEETSPEAQTVEESGPTLSESFGQCAAELFHEPLIIMAFLNHYRSHTIPIGELTYASAPSSALVDLIEEFQNRFHPELGILSDPIYGSTLRSEFKDDELVELLALNQRLLREWDTSVNELAQVIQEHEAMLAETLKTPRYRAMQLIVEMKDPTQRATATSLLANLIDTLGGKNRLLELENGAYSAHSIYPFGLISIIPFNQMSKGDIDFKSDDPFNFAKYAQQALMNSMEAVEGRIAIYKAFRDRASEVYKITRVQPDASAVRVAFLDSGIDPIKYNHLGMGAFLSLNEPGRVASYDFSDLDANPYIPEIGWFGHGTLVMGTFLHVLGRTTRSILDQKKLDVGMWKTVSNMNLLGNYDAADSKSTWTSNPYAYMHALRTVIKDTSKRPKPDIVSVSMVTTVNNILAALKEPELIKQAPWLWVMAAGNEARDVTSSAADVDGKHGCFTDIPEASRPKDQILCVGAVRAGYGKDYVASYSNFGKDVDVYTYQLFESKCPRGTSCSTPAIAAAATHLKFLYPTLSPSQLKTALVLASEERELEVDIDIDNDRTGFLSVPKLTLEKRKIHFFDPLTMMDRAEKEALKLVGKTSI